MMLKILYSQKNQSEDANQKKNIKIKLGNEFQSHENGYERRVKNEN